MWENCSINLKPVNGQNIIEKQKMVYKFHLKPV